MSEQDIPNFLKPNGPVFGSMPHRSFPPVTYAPTPKQLSAAIIAYDFALADEKPTVASRFAAMRAALIAANETR